MKNSILNWHEAEQTQQALWRAENGSLPPKKFILADDTLDADTAYKLACEGCGLLWQGDFQLAKQLLQAMARRYERSAKKTSFTDQTPEQSFHLHRKAQVQRTRILGMLLIPLHGDYQIPLRRAPNVVAACIEVYGEITDATPHSIVSLRELLSLIGAYEWRKKGVFVAELNAKIYPHYGVFSPIRSEYLSLVANAPLPTTTLAFDIGTGTGVLAALLAKRGVQKIIATDIDRRALACAMQNMHHLGYADQVEVTQADLFPPGSVPLIVCNPPWIPAKPSSPIEYAIFDPQSRMLKNFLSGLSDHLTEDGEGWLILSDFAEHLGLRSRAELMSWISQASLRVIERIDIKPHHPKVMDHSNPLYQARSAEVTSLWRLARG